MSITYDLPLYRPPSEGRNLIVQATLGCSFNHCTSCSMYKSKAYQVRPLDVVYAEIDAMANSIPHAHRIFLADGDALALPTDHLVSLLDHLAARFCDLTRVTTYATPKNLLDKTPEDLDLLRKKGLKLVYLGIESGANVILKRIIKGASQKTHAKAIERARELTLKYLLRSFWGLAGAKTGRLILRALRS